jgi:Na+/H+ antiporter NhaB
MCAINNTLVVEKTAVFGKTANLPQQIGQMLSHKFV